VDNLEITEDTGLIEAQRFAGITASFFPIWVLAMQFPAATVASGLHPARMDRKQAAVLPGIRGNAVVEKKDISSVLYSACNPGLPYADTGRQVGESACSFAGFRLEADGTLWRGEAVVHLPPRELAALRLLMARAGQVVSPLQLKKALWGDVHVTADSVLKCLSGLRARLEPDACIQTVYKRGYRFTEEIKWSGSGKQTGAPIRLAILPFATGYSVPEHIGPAMAEETTASLSRADHFAVIILARDSVFSLAQRGLTAQQIGQQLKADLVLTGTLQAFSWHYRLRAEMIRVENGSQIWVEDILAPRSHTGELEMQLMQRLAYRLGLNDSIGAELPGSDQGLPARRDTALPPKRRMADLQIAAAAEIEEDRAPRQQEAYDEFLRGHHEWQTLHRHRMQDGLQRLLQAIELDPTLISAKVDLARLCVSQALFGFMSPSASAELVHRVAGSIPDLPHHAAALLPELGWVNFHYNRNLPAALLAFSFSAHLPHNPWTTRSRSIFAISLHRYDEAIDLLRAAIRIDPFSPWLQNRLAWVFHLDGQRDESVRQIRNNIALFPDHVGTGLYGSAILAFNGEAEQSVALAQSLVQRSPHFDLAVAVHAYALACMGRADEARNLLQRLQWLGRERYVTRAMTPAAYLALGDREAALAELRDADEARCPWFFQMLDDPRLVPLHGNPEFERMRAILPAMEAEAALNLKMED
jgi:DNA-binding winged helix-turn-helix (wHTH) protein/tetratricopeptide (TPR) repeat protein